MSTLAQRLSEALSELPGKSQADLARACGVTSPSVNGWFSGKTQSLKDKSLTRAAEFLNVEEKWLSEGIGPKRKSQSNVAYTTQNDKLGKTPRKILGVDKVYLLHNY